MSEVSEPATQFEDQSDGGLVNDQDEGDLVDISKTSVRIEKNDRALAQLYDWYRDGRLDIDPEWQREFVWDKRRSSKLIESVLRDIPIPVIYLGQTESGDYEVIDGLQRLKSVFLFFDNEYSLTGLELMPEHNGKSFKDLSKKEQNKLRDSTLRTYELASDTPKDLMFVIFERLNTGGVKLNEQEIRNCLFRGELNDLINRLAKDPAFVACIGQDLHKRMKDRMFVLRFLAFYERTHHKVTKGLKSFLNDFLSHYRNPTEDKLKEFETAFRKSVKAAKTIFGDRGFRVWSGSSGWSKTPNVAIFQAVATSFCDYDLGQLTRAADCVYEAYLDLVTTDTQFHRCVTQATADANRISYAFTTWRNRLARAVAGTPANDSVRCFSRTLKENMFKTDDACAICGQKISLLDDAALDHDTEYWRGGLTVPANARLTHRLCNLQKGKGAAR